MERERPLQHVASSIGHLCFRSFHFGERPAGMSQHNERAIEK